MAIDLMDEHEQSERVRAWLRDNGGAIVGGIAIGLAGIFAWQWWGNSKVEHRIDAASQYQALVEAVERKDRDTVDSVSQSLSKDFADTPYASFAALARADQLLEAGENEGAVASLKKAIELAPDAALAGLARVRLARAQLGAGEHQAALDALKSLTVDAYQGVAEELRGDALLAMGDAEAARTAYSTALEKLDEAAPSRRLVEMKLVDLGGKVPVMDPVAPVVETSGKES
ncbi:MAG: YfgM family protein [Pseudomarimonas sp.]